MWICQTYILNVAFYIQTYYKQAFCVCSKYKEYTQQIATLTNEILIHSSFTNQISRYYGSLTLQKTLQMQKFSEIEGLRKSIILENPAMKLKSLILGQSQWKIFCSGLSGFDPWVGKIPWRRQRQPTPVFWPGEFHGLNSP